MHQPISFASGKACCIKLADRSSRSAEDAVLCRGLGCPQEIHFFFFRRRRRLVMSGYQRASSVKEVDIFGSNGAKLGIS